MISKSIADGDGVVNIHKSENNVLSLLQTLTLGITFFQNLYFIFRVSILPSCALFVYNVFTSVHGFINCARASLLQIFYVSYKQTYNIISSMDDLVMEEEDDCPELVPIDPQPRPPEQIPVTIITGYLGITPAALLRYFPPLLTTLMSL